jgi:hypothetical protein
MTRTACPRTAPHGWFGCVPVVLCVASASPRLGETECSYSTIVGPMSGYAHVRNGSMLSKKSQTALRLIFRRKTNHATIVRRYAPRPVTEVTGEFIALLCLPHTFIRSPRLRLGEFVFSDAKRLFRQHRSNSEVGPLERQVHSTQQQTSSDRPSMSGLCRYCCKSLFARWASNSLTRG